MDLAWIPTVKEPGKSTNGGTKLREDRTQCPSSVAYQVPDMLMNLDSAIQIVNSLAFLFPDEGEHNDTQVLRI